MDRPLPTPEQQYKTLRVLWFAMMAATLIYLFLGFVQANGAQAMERSPIANMVWLFGLVFVGLGFLLPNMLIKGSDVPNKVMIEPIIRWAMFESFAVIALLNRFSQGASLIEFAAGILISFALILTHPPKAPSGTS